jgi:hypothetical protein
MIDASGLAAAWNPALTVGTGIVAGPTATRGHGAPRSATAKWGKSGGGRGPKTGLA